MRPEGVSSWAAEVMAPHWTKLNREYVAKRRRWYRAIGWPVKGHEATPDPGKIPETATEEG